MAKRKKKKGRRGAETKESPPQRQKLSRDVGNSIR